MSQDPRGTVLGHLWLNHSWTYVCFPLWPSFPPFVNFAGFHDINLVECWLCSEHEGFKLSHFRRVGQPKQQRVAEIGDRHHQKRQGQRDSAENIGCMKMTVWRWPHVWKFSQGWLWWTGNHRASGSCSIRTCQYSYFLSICKGLRLSPTIAGFSRHHPDSLWHLDIVAFLSRKPETCPEGKARAWDFLRRQIYPPAKLVSPQTSKRSWAGGGGGPWQPSLWPPTFCHKRALSPICWRLWRHTSAGRILWSKYQPEFT